MSIDARCPICRKRTVREFRPFCSRGCRDRDFVNWADARYALPAPMDLDEEPDKDDE